MVIRNTPRCDQVILAVKPDVYVKAADYSIDTLDMSEFAALRHVSATVNFVPLVEGYSTSDLLVRWNKLQNPFPKSEDVWNLPRHAPRL